MLGVGLQNPTVVFHAPAGVNVCSFCARFFAVYTSTE